MNTDFVIYDGRSSTLGILYNGEESLCRRPRKGFVMRETEAGMFHVERVIFAVKSLGDSFHSSREEMVDGLSVFCDQSLCGGLMEETVLLKLASFVSPKVVTALFQIEKVEDVFVYRSRQCKGVVAGEAETLCESCKEIFDALILQDAPSSANTKLKQENETEVKEDYMGNSDGFEMNIKEEAEAEGDSDQTEEVDWGGEEEEKPVMKKFRSRQMETHPCKECGAIFKYRRALSTHIAKHHGDDVDSFDEMDSDCSYNPDDEGGARQKKKKKRPQNPDSAEVTSKPKYSCLKCDATFQYEKAFKSHVEKTHEDDADPEWSDTVQPVRVRKQREIKQKYYCDKCPQVFGYRKRYMVHLETRHGVKVESKDIEADNDNKLGRSRDVKCDQCDVVLQKGKSYNNHMRQVHDIEVAVPVIKKSTIYEKKYECKHCGKKYSEFLSYKKHLQKMHDDDIQRPAEKTFYMKKCPYCEMEFRVVHGEISCYTLTRHLVHLHLDKSEEPETKELFESYEKQKVVCPICGKSYLNHPTLRDHMNVKHGTVETASCHICGKEIRKGGTAMYCHLMTHEKKNLPCSYCGKVFGNKFKLGQHEQIHMPGFVRFECKQCDYKCGRKQALKQHIRFVHNKERPIQCDQCDKAFKIESCLLKHKRSVHLKEQPYDCEVCGFRTGYISNLNTHRQKTHQIEKFLTMQDIRDRKKQREALMGKINKEEYINEQEGWRI